MSNVTIKIPLDVACQALDALAVRARWYETRGYDTPPEVARALAYVAAELGVDPTKIDGRRGR